MTPQQSNSTTSHYLRRTPQMLLPTLFFSLVLLLPCYSHCCTISNTYSSTRVYALDVRTTYANVSERYYGRQQVSLEYAASNIVGYLSWNFTWDEGSTWQGNNSSALFHYNRTYQYFGVNRLTAWWIDPNQQLGNQIKIDGDPPITNNFPRIAPFVVSEITTMTVNTNAYRCWILNYQTDEGQRERFYYEYYTGILVAVDSSIHRIGVVHETRLELITSTPRLPQTTHFNHYINYGLFLGIAITSSFILLACLWRKRTKTTKCSSPFQN